MVMPKDYDDMVDRKLREIRGNVSSVKMTEAECQAEIGEITGIKYRPAATLAEGATIGGTETRPDGTVIKIEAMPIIQPKRKGGWPKGKKRGPRKAK